MSAVAAMAGAAAGNVRRKRLHEKIDCSFDSIDAKKNARTVLGLIDEGTNGNPGVAVASFILGIPAMCIGMVLGENLFGSGGALVGCFLGPFIIFGCAWRIDIRFFKKPAEKRLAEFVAIHRDGADIEAKVRKILSEC